MRFMKARIDPNEIQRFGFFRMILGDLVQLSHRDAYPWFRNIAGSRVRLENQKTGADVHQRGHFYLAESGHFYLATTAPLRIMYIMLNNGLPAACGQYLGLCRVSLNATSWLGGCTPDIATVSPCSITSRRFQNRDSLP